MSYLIPNDINRLIQDPTLQQIISGNSLLTYQAEITALTEIKSYLSAKYDNSAEFTDSMVYNPATIYKATNRVYLNAPTYSTTATYILNQLTLQAGSVYYCSTAIPVAQPFTISNWTLLGAQYDTFFANYPFPLFNLNACYRIGDNVFWQHHTYTCKQSSIPISQESLIQYQNTYNVPYKNVFPDDRNVGSQYWTDNGAYSIPAGSLLVQSAAPVYQFFQARNDLFIFGGISAGFLSLSNYYTDATLKGWTYSLELVDQGTLTPGIDYTVNPEGGWTLSAGRIVQPGEKYVHHFNPVVSETQSQPLPSSQTLSQLLLTYFTKGDNRNQQLVTICLDIMIYTMYRRIPPAVVPEIRIFAYQQAIAWLKNVSKGDDVIADIAKKQPLQGSRTRFGSQPKQVNNY